MRISRTRLFKTAHVVSSTLCMQALVTWFVASACYPCFPRTRAVLSSPSLRDRYSLHRYNMGRSDCLSDFNDVFGFPSTTFIRRWRNRVSSPKFLTAHPATHAAVLDPGGTPRPHPLVGRFVLPSTIDSVSASTIASLSERFCIFGAQSIRFRCGLCPPCLRFTPPVTRRRARLGTALLVRLCAGVHLSLVPPSFLAHVKVPE